MFSTKHCFEKKAIKMIGFWLNRYDRANLTPFIPVLVLITRVIHRPTLHFEVARNIVYLSQTLR